jgi:hypothetical protein
MKPLNAAQALRIEAIRLSRLAIKAGLKAAGVKIAYIENAEITKPAKEWFGEHRAEIAGEALGNVLRAQLRSTAQKSKAQKSMASAVQISGVK